MVQRTKAAAAAIRHARWSTPLAVIAVLVLVLGAVASAGHSLASLPTSDFEVDVDANLVVDDAGKDDWASVTELRRSDVETGKNDDSYAGGSKENDVCPGTTTGSIPNNKSDLLDFGVYTEPGDPGFLHLFWSRVKEPSGTTLMDFELNQSSVDCGNGVNKLRTVGDLLIEYKIEQGGASATIVVREWEGTQWGPEQDLTAIGAATGTINDSAIAAADSDGLGDLDPRTFGEASLDLDFIFDETSCTSFGSAFLKSRASDSFTSQMKDYIAPQPINITNCGTVIIRKQTNPDEDPNTTEFDFTKAFATDPVSVNSFKLKDDGSITFNNVLFGENYTVSEGTLPTGWQFDNVDCSASSGVSPSISGATVTFDIDAATDVLDCTYNNDAFGQIIVEKQTVPDGSSQSFVFAADYDNDGFSLSDGQSDTSVLLAPGSYDVTETVPAGWDLTNRSCALQSGPTPLSASNKGDDAVTVNLAAGQTVKCTFTNTQRGQIIVEKQTVPDGSSQSFVFAADYDNDGFSLSDGQSDTSVLLAPGSYDVTETVPAGWDLTNRSCALQSGPTPLSASNKGDDAVTVNLAAGQTVKCTFTNTQRGQIIVEKQTVPDGSSQSFVFAADYDNDGFSLSDGQSDTSVLLAPGSYDVTETVPAGWDLTNRSCALQSGPTPLSASNKGDDAVTVNLAAGQTVKCTFTNTQRGQIIVEKQTVPDGSSQSFVFAADYDNDGFSLSDGQSDTSVLLAPGSYDVTETVPAGWDLTNRSCALQSGPTPLSASNKGDDAVTVNLAAGQTVKCTFTNTQRGQITVIKTDDAGNRLGGVTFSLWVDDGTDDTTFDDQEDTDTGQDCTTEADEQEPDFGECEFTNLLPGAIYWVVEDSAPDGYEGDDPIRVDLAAGGSPEITFENPRLHKVILLVCHMGTNDLAPSDWDLGDSLGAEAITTMGPSELTTLANLLSVDEDDLQAALCGLEGFEDLSHGTHEFVVDIHNLEE